MTNQEGKASVPQLPLGVYRIEETTPPTGYKLPENPVGSIDLTQGDEQTVHYKVKNKKIVTGSLVLRKLSDVPCISGSNSSVVIQLPSNNGGVVVKPSAVKESAKGCHITSTIIYQPPYGGVVVKGSAVRVNENSRSSTVYALSGVVFALKQGDQELYTATSDPYGVVRFENIPEGTYTLVEKSTVDGYAINFEPREVTIDEDHQMISLGNVENKLIKGNVKVKKVDADDKSKLLPGVVFALKQGDKEIARATTDANGEALFEGLTKGTYTLVEVSTIDGYVLSQEAREVTISELDQVVDVEFENRQIKGTIKVKKVDADDKTKVLEGVVFVLKQGDKIVAEAKTDANGVATFTDVLHGTYTLAEKSTIDGYVLSDETREVTVSRDSAMVDLGTFTNKKKPKETPPPTSSSSSSTSSSTEPSSSTSTSTSSIPPTSGQTPPPATRISGKQRALLPRTGETTSVWMGLLGLALLVLLGFVYHSKKQ